MDRLRRGTCSGRRADQCAEDPQKREEDPEEEQEAVALTERCDAEGDQAYEVQHAKANPEDGHCGTSFLPLGGNRCPPSSCWASHCSSSRSDELRHQASSTPSGTDSPRATMISGAAATTLAPPTWGATARSTPRRFSALAPSSSAFATCHAYEAGEASSATSAAIFTSANVRASRPVASSPDSRSPIASSSSFRSPPEI